MDSGWLSPGARKVAAGTAAAVFLWFLVDLLWVTEAERIRAAVQGLRDDFAARRLDRCIAFVAEDYQGHGGDRQGLDANARSFVAQYDPQGLTYDIKAVRIDGDRAEVEGICFVRPGPRSQLPAPYRGRLVLRLRRLPPDAPAGELGTRWRLIELTFQD